MTSMRADSPSPVDNPFFARLWVTVSQHETETLQRLRRANLDGLTGRVLEIGAGTGTNFAYYPRTVDHVVAIEPERRLRPHAENAATAAPVNVTVSGAAVEEFVSEQPFDAVVCSLVLCSVDDLNSVVAQLFSICRPGGELRFLEHVASSGWRGRMQQLADATIWPRLIGGCHTHRDTVGAIRGAGFLLDDVRHEWTVPGWAPLPVSEHVIGRARRPVD